MKKRFLGMMLAGLLSVSMASQALAIDYTDLSKDHWAYKQIEELTNANILVGYPDKTFHPDEKVTRAEFATMVIKTVGQENAKITEVINFNDIDNTYWAWDMIQRAVTFDIIKRSSDNAFYPMADVTRSQALTFVVNALDTGNIAEYQAKAALMANYDDYKSIPSWVAYTAGKAEVLGIVVKVPGKEKLMEAERPASRAELAVFLYNLREQVQIRANEKLREAMKPKTADGIVIDGVRVDGNIATLPVGTILPVVMRSQISSQTSKLGEVFVTKTPKNFVTKERYLLIVEDTPIAGQLIDVKVARYFVRNGKVCLETKSIKVQDKQVARFSALGQTDLVIKGFWQKLFRTIFKGAKIEVKDGQVINIQLLKPVKINMSTGFIVE